MANRATGVQVSALEQRAAEAEARGAEASNQAEEAEGQLAAASIRAQEAELAAAGANSRAEEAEHQRAEAASLAEAQNAETAADAQQQTEVRNLKRKGSALNCLHDIERLPLSCGKCAI